MDQIAMQRKRGYLIIDCFLRIGRGAPDDLPKFIQNMPYIFRESVDIFIHGLELSSGSHLDPSLIPWQLDPL
jgi:hypothetical protein